MLKNWLRSDWNGVEKAGEMWWEIRSYRAGIDSLESVTMNQKLEMMWTVKKKTLNGQGHDSPNPPIYGWLTYFQLMLHRTLHKSTTKRERERERDHGEIFHQYLRIAAHQVTGRERERV